MRILRNRGSAGALTVVMIVLMIVGLVLVNRWLQKQADEIVSKPVQAPAVTTAQKKQAAPPKIKRQGDVIRDTRFCPDRKCEINIFYQEGVEIARTKTANEETLEQTGEIPDGKVKFINESDKTYGVEYYRDQRLHGPAKIFYSDNVLKKEAYYQYGKLMTSTEYYSNGNVCRQEDYTNARENIKGIETGVGKIYFWDGTIKYEWHLTVTDQVGFRKFYNQHGTLVDTVYYDEFGQIVDLEETAPVVGAPQGTDAPVITDMPSDPYVPPTVEKPPKQIFVPMNL